MSYNKTLVADAVVTRLIENQGVYGLCNRSFDGLVKEGASSVDVPALPLLKVKSSGTAKNDADRKKTKTDTSMVNVPLVPRAIPIEDEILGQWESNDMLRREFITSAGMTYQEYFDEFVVTEALTTNQTIEDFAVMQWSTLTSIWTKLTKNKVPRTRRVIAIDADLADQFFSIDVVKQATAFHLKVFESGELVQVMGMKFFITALMPKAAGDKPQICGWYGPGLAFILSRYMQLKSVYDEMQLSDIHDLLSHIGAKLFDPKFAVKGKAT